MASVVINLTIPKPLEMQMEAQLGDFISPAELVRYSMMRLMMQLAAKTTQEKLEMLQKLAKKGKHEPFDEEKELARLRQIREELWEKRHGKGSA